LKEFNFKQNAASVTQASVPHEMCTMCKYVSGKREMVGVGKALASLLQNGCQTIKLSIHILFDFMLQFYA